MQHLLVTRDFLPELSGSARRLVGLARRYPEPMSVSTVAARDSLRVDSAEEFKIERQPFGRRNAGSLVNRVRWESWLLKRCNGRIHVLHAGDIAVAGRVVWRIHRRARLPYVVHVSASELNMARERARRGVIGRRQVRLVLGDAAGIVATTSYVADLARSLIAELGISQPPPVAATGLGADPILFAPARDTGTLRQRWGIRRAPILLTVARLAEHKGQDLGIGALALLRDEFPNLRYVLVGEGGDEARLRNLAADLNVMDRVGFAGPMRDDELPEAYATATLYLDMSRAADGGALEGHGFALVEAQASGLPIVTSGASGASGAGGAGGANSIVRDGETAMVVTPATAESVAGAITILLRDGEMRSEMGLAGREAVEGRLNWIRVANDTARFVRECVAGG